MQIVGSFARRGSLEKSDASVTGRTVRFRSDLVG
jgi:hypothetical protein